MAGCPIGASRHLILNFGFRILQPHPDYLHYIYLISPSTMTNDTINTNLLRQIFFIAIILFLGIVLFRELWFFAPAFLGSVTFYVIMRERMFYLTEKKKWKPYTAAWVLMLLSFFVILVPIGVLGNILYSKISYVVIHSDEYIAQLKSSIQKIQESLGYQILTPNYINQLANFLTQLLPKVLNI